MKYTYKQFNSAGYVGVLNPLNDFEITEEINTAGSQLIIELGTSFEQSESTVTSDILVTETPENIVDELSGDILISSSLQLNNIPNLNDRIEVWNETERIFNGLVSKWETNYSDDKVKVTVLSYGVQLDNYLVQIVPNSEATGNPTAQYDADMDLDGISSGQDGSTQNAVSQVFQVAADLDVSTISVYVTDIINYAPLPPEFDRLSSGTLYLYAGTPASKGALLGSVSLSQITTLGWVDFTFATPISILDTTDYFIDLVAGGAINRGGSTLTVGYETTGTYSDGKLYEHLIETTYTGKGYTSTDTWTETDHDLIFSIKTSTGAVGNQFNSYDPSDIVRALLNGFKSLGGNLSYTADSIQNTGSVVSYTFKFNTYFDALKKCVELSPANWFWAVNPGSGIVSFKQKPSTVSHTLIKGKHLSNFEISQSLESMKNSVYFTGAETDGVNLQVNELNTLSVSTYGQWLELATDNRVTDTDSANIIVSGILSEKSQPRFSVSNVTIPSTVYDITTFEVGQSVGFANFNGIINSLQLQIMSIVRTPDYATLALEVLPPTQSKRLEDIKRNLLKKETENNPAT